MARDVEATWSAILSDHVMQKRGGKKRGGLGEGGDKEVEVEEGEGEEIVRELKDNSRYLVDAWTS